MKELLISLGMVGLVLGGPTFAIWFRSGRTLPLKYCYYRGLAYFVAVFGLLFGAVAALLFFLVLSDQLGLSSFGYPAFALFATGAGSMVGIVIYKVSSPYLKRKA